MATADDEQTRVVGNKPRAGKAGKNLFDDFTPVAKTLTTHDESESALTKTVFYAKSKAESVPADSLTVLAQPVSAASTHLEGRFQDFMHDPVVGWVVIIRGAGKGTSLPLGYGANAMGRANTQRVRLDFGDIQISRESHAVITYEPRGRQFYLQNGTSVNLTYLDTDQGTVPVLTPMQLSNGQTFQLGSTTLKFIALCGAEFDWHNANEEV